jgi:elongation factor 2
MNPVKFLIFWKIKFSRLLFLLRKNKMAKKETGLEKINRLTSTQKNIRNIATSAHIHHGKTALTDNLLAASGYMAAKNAGDLEEGMATWQHGDEQERLMTVDSANVSMVHEFNGEEFLINLIDTPGHVDFGGNVTRAMRAIDGTIVLVCASEGIMPQTETVVKQAVRERVKPVLFINKMDRLIKELKLTPEGIQQRLLKIITDFNILLSQIAEPEFRQKWQVDVNDGSVAFGSARDNWALSVPFMKKKGISFKDVLNIYNMGDEERKEWCWKNAPLFEVLLDMVIKHLPNPIDAQKYRIPKIWKGDMETQFGKDLVNCNPEGKPAFVITRIVIDPRSGKEVCAGRLFSGTIKNGQEVYLNLAKSKQRVQQVLVYNGIKPEQLEQVPCGNVLAIAGINGEAGETVTLDPETPFEELKHIFEPVITKSISVPKPQDLPKLIEVLKKVAKEDPSIKVQINEETGENLISGMGELHLEIIENRIKTEKGVDVKTSSPIVVYRETVDKPGEVGEGKSPNKHNLFFLKVEPLEPGVYQAIKNREISEGRIKKKDEPLWKKLNELGISNEEARQYIDVYKDNVFLNKIKGEVNIGEVIELVLDAFEQVIDAGPIAREPCIKMKVSLVDIKLHEDAIHRGPAQVYPAVRDAVRAAMATAKPVLYEPLQTVLFEGPLTHMGAMTKMIQSKRGQLIDVQQTTIDCTIKAKLPVSEMIGLASDLRSETEGRGSFSMVDQSFEKMPGNIQDQVVRNIRARKGLADNE